MIRLWGTAIALVGLLGSSVAAQDAKTVDAGRRLYDKVAEHRGFIVYERP